MTSSCGHVAPHREDTSPTEGALKVARTLPGVALEMAASSAGEPGSKGSRAEAVEPPAGEGAPRGNNDREDSPVV